MSHFATTTLKGKLSAIQKVNDNLVIGRSDGFIEIIKKCNNEDIKVNRNATNDIESLNDTKKNINKHLIDSENINIDNENDINHIDNEMYKSYYIFKSHEPEFDYLESAEISEKISVIEDIEIGDSYMNILTGNEKTVKLWNIRDTSSKYTEYIEKNKTDMQMNLEKQDAKKEKFDADFETDKNKKNKLTIDFHTEMNGKTKLLFELQKTHEKTNYKSFLYNEYKNMHQYTLNDIKSYNFTNTFLSCDYLRIHFNDIEYTQSYNLIDIKPQKYEDLTFVITGLYTNKDSSFLYSTSKGEVLYQDMRINPKSKQTKSYVAMQNDDEVLKSICQMQVIDNILVTRDLEGINLFDLRNEKQITSFNLLKQKKLNTLIESGSIYEKIRIQKNENYVITGGFNSTITVLNVSNYNVKEIEVETEFVKHVEFFDDSFVYGDDHKLYFYR